MSHFNTHYVFHLICFTYHYSKYSFFYLDKKEENEILDRSFVQKFQILSFLPHLGLPILLFLFL